MKYLRVVFFDERKWMLFPLFHYSPAELFLT